MTAIITILAVITLVATFCAFLWMLIASAFNWRPFQITISDLGPTSAHVAHPVLGSIIVVSGTSEAPPILDGSNKPTAHCA